MARHVYVEGVPGGVLFAAVHARVIEDGKVNALDVVQHIRLAARALVAAERAHVHVGTVVLGHHVGQQLGSVGA